ncbi:MAG: tRNA uridine-5-carboxymethylaminomethyl(34) synthesis GTPase MnmE, partial [Planctomycetota bacterium]
MLTGQTIVAQASAPGASPRMVLRLSGDRTRTALESLNISVPQSRRASTSTLRWDAQRTLPCILLWMPAPHSYTTEDCAEIQLPATRTIAQHILDRLTRIDDVRLAQPGEFSARAFLHGRISIEQAE